MSDVITQEPRPRRWTQEEYHQMADAGVIASDARVELVEGRIVGKGVQTSRHATAVSLIKEVLNRHRGENHTTISHAPVALNTYTELEPDIAVVKGTARDYSEAHPTTAELVVEASDSTLKYDRTTKAGLYARADIREYWILNIIDRQLEVHRQPEPMDDHPHGYGYVDIRIVDETEQAAPLLMPDRMIKVADMLP